jgi:hypothetical protein
MPDPRRRGDLRDGDRRNRPAGAGAGHRGRGGLAVDPPRRRQRQGRVYGGISSIRHYLAIEQDRRRAVYHERGPSGGLEPRILRDGEIVLDPPGVRLALDELYRDTELAAP